MAVQISGNDITVPRDGTFSRNVSIAGTLTYEDVTNVDSIGLVTARNGIEVGASPGVAASISVDGNAIFSGITTATTIKSTTGIVTTLTSTTLNVDGGDATFTGASANIIFDKSDDALEFNDDAKATFGTGADTTLTHSGADFAITNTTGNLNILNNSADAVQIRHGSETMIKAVSDGAVELYHDDSKKLETASGGVTVTGTLAATALTGDGSGLTGISGGLFSSYAVITDEKSNGTDGGDFNSGAWRMRDLNTEKFDPDGIVSVSSNEFSLGTGTYYIEVFAPAYGVARHMAKIYSVSSPSEDWYGESAFAHGSHYATTHSFVRARITCSGTRNLAIAHQCETSRSSTGMGIASNFGNVETYTVVKIFKES